MRRAADQAQGAAAAGQPKPVRVYGEAAGKRIEVRVSYAGELGLEEAVSRYLAARENARARRRCRGAALTFRPSLIWVPPSPRRHAASRTPQARLCWKLENEGMACLCRAKGRMAHFTREERFAVFGVDWSSLPAGPCSLPRA